MYLRYFSIFSFHVALEKKDELIIVTHFCYSKQFT